MKNRRLIKVIIGAMTVLGICAASFLFSGRGRPAQIPTKHELFDGVTYRRVVRYVPRPMVAHVLVIDRKVKGMSFLVTPPDSEGESPLKARTTSQFLEEFDLQIAINGDGFTPWWSHSPVDYYPHAGDPVAPLGLTASNGNVYSMGVERQIGIEPTLFISRRNGLWFNDVPRRVYTAISGERMLVVKGEPDPGLDDEELEPRTAIGLNRNGRYLILIVVDGRQPFYSDGATFADLAALLVKQKAFFAMSLDGGGSSTMIIEGEDGQPVILNSPVDLYIPGRERPVGNHFGVYVK
jgi:hypothetical protein